MSETRNLGVPVPGGRLFSNGIHDIQCVSANHHTGTNVGGIMPRHGGLNALGQTLTTPYNSVVEDQRRISSVIVKEEYLQGTATHRGEEVKYVEVPFVEEVIRTVPRKQIVEVEKKVPKIEYQYVDKTVEVPKIEYVDRIVEVPKYEEEIRYVTKQEYVDVPREIIEEVPIVEKRIKEEIVEVPGKIIEIQKKQVIESETVLPRYIQQEQPVVVAQTLHPHFVPSQEAFHVNVNHYEAEIVEVEIPIAKIVDVPLRLGGLISETHAPVEVSAAQYNSMLKLLNPHISASQLTEASFLRREGNGYPELAAEDARKFISIDPSQRGVHRTGHLEVSNHKYVGHVASTPPPRSERVSPAINARPPYASNIGINAGIASFPAYESTYSSVSHKKRRHRRHEKNDQK